MNVDWTTIALVAGGVIPVLGVPLALVSQYLKALHEYHVRRGDDLIRHLNHLKDEVTRLAKLVRDFERSYTTRDDWLREVASTQGHLQKLTGIVTQLQVELKSGNGATLKLLKALDHAAEPRPRQDHE